MGVDLRAKRNWEPFAFVIALCVGVVASPSSAVAAPSRTFVVNSLADGVDDQVGDGVCLTAAQTCTLRAAVQEADAGSAPTTITLPDGVINMSIPTKWPLPSQTADLKTDPAYGELNIFQTVTITGKGANRTTINGRHLDRIFNVEPGASLSISRVTLTGGDATVNDRTSADIAIGGAILNLGSLTVERVAIVGNRADGGGGIFSTPFTTFTVRNSLIANNAAVEGGGLRIDGGATIINSTITGNHLFARPFGAYIPDEITGYGGGIDHRGTGAVTIVNSTITNNRAIKAGGGYNSGQGYAPVGSLTQVWPYRTTLLNTVIANNSVRGKTQNCHVSDMVIASRGHNLADDSSCFLNGVGDLSNRPARLGSLGHNRGPTETQMPLPGSLLVDHGSNVGCPSGDQRGVRRPQGRACDIGAVEVAP